MRHAIVLLTAWYVIPLPWLHAADKAETTGPPQYQGLGPSEGAPAIAMDGPPKLISDPSATEAYSRTTRTCTGVPSLTVTPGGRLWVAWYSGTTPGAKIETCPNAYVVVSTSRDGGKTWKEVLAIDPDGPGPLKAVDPRPWVDPEGRLWIIWHLTVNGVSYKYLIAESFSADRGITWSQPKPSAIKHTASRFYIGRLQSGNLLLVKHGGIDVDLASVGRKQRRELTAFISQDDGRTWSSGLLIDERVGCTYPDAQQTADGTMYLTWDFQRSSEQEILLTTFTEADVLSASEEATASVKANRRLVSKGGVE